MLTLQYVDFVSDEENSNGLRQGTGQRLIPHREGEDISAK